MSRTSKLVIGDLFMKNNEEFVKYIKWALESEENKKQAIQKACSLISFLTPVLSLCS